TQACTACWSSTKTAALSIDASGHTAGIAEGDHVCRDGARHNATGAYRRVVADLHARQDGDTGSQPDATTDPDGQSVLAARDSFRRVDWVRGGGNDHVGRNHHVVADCDGSAVQNDKVVVGVDTPAKVDVLAVVAEERWLEVSICLIAQELDQG